MAPGPSPEQIRALRAENRKTRSRDLAAAHGLTEAALVAAQVGHGTTAIAPHPDRILPHVAGMGEVMALTRNESCVHEKVGVYSDYRPGEIAAMVLDPEIDLRIFPAHWKHAFAVVEETENGPKRSIQIFDAAGDAVHKIFLRETSDLATFERMRTELALPAQADTLDLQPRRAVEGPKGDSSRQQELRAAWARMTDTHQFLKMVKDLGMNRLGANRAVGTPHSVPLARDAVTVALQHASAQKVPVMIFVGNMGCIQIHGGPVDRIVPMGPWINILDPRFDMHLRTDHVAEVWLVEKPTRSGPAISVEAFDADGMLILQIFGYRKDTPAAPWNALCAGLPRLEEVPA